MTRIILSVFILFCFRGITKAQTGDSKNFKGMEMRMYEEEIAKDNFTLVYFTADWCAPCKKLSPSVDSAAIRFKGRLTILKIDIDKNPDIKKGMIISSIPVLFLYNKGVPVWMTEGLIDKNELFKNLELYTGN